VTYIVQADIEARLTAEVVRRVLDDDRDLTPDAANLDRVISDAESYVEGFLRGTYDLTALRAMGTGCPNEVKRLCLDVATAMMWERHPEYIRADGESLLARAREDLRDLRMGITRLDVTGTPENAANQGGIVESGDPDDTEPPDAVFMNGLGNW
jgi:phage gp36-like protein